MNITWFYNYEEKAIRAERDSNADGQIDTWYHYENGRVKAVEEDTNGDGKPDLWEAYDVRETLIRRAKDLNFDGIPDLEDIQDAGTDGSSTPCGQTSKR